jgi:hypothetical protein
MFSQAARSDRNPDYRLAVATISHKGTQDEKALIDPTLCPLWLRVKTPCSSISLFNGDTEQFGVYPATPEFQTSPPNRAAEPGQHESSLLIERYLG